MPRVEQRHHGGSERDRVGGQVVHGGLNRVLQPLPVVALGRRDRGDRLHHVGRRGGRHRQHREPEPRHQRCLREAPSYPRPGHHDLLTIVPGGRPPPREDSARTQQAAPYAILREPRPPLSARGSMTSKERRTHERRSIDMDQITNTLQSELRQTLDRLRQLGGAVVFEDYPGALEAGDDGEVGGDSVNASEERELSFAFRGRLVDRANRLADALDRLRSGEYGTCEACGDRIAPARLRPPAPVPSDAQPPSSGAISRAASAAVTAPPSSPGSAAGPLELDLDVRAGRGIIGRPIQCVTGAGERRPRRPRSLRDMEHDTRSAPAHGAGPARRLRDIVRGAGGSSPR